MTEFPELGVAGSATHFEPISVSDESTVVCAMPARMPPTIESARSSIRFVMPPSFMTAPASTNSGMARRGNGVMPATRRWAPTDSGASVVSQMAMNDAAASANPTGTRSSIAAPKVDKMVGPITPLP